jgi:hypothetical protein
MTTGPGAKDALPSFTEEEMVWIEANLPELRRTVSEDRIRYVVLGIGFVVGLASHVGGFLLKSSTATEPVALLGDLLYTFGWALWTGVVVVVLFQIVPEAKRRQIKRYLDAYETVQRERARTERARTSTDDGAPTTR